VARFLSPAQLNDTGHYPTSGSERCAAIRLRRLLSLYIEANRSSLSLRSARTSTKRRVREGRYLVQGSERAIERCRKVARDSSQRQPAFRRAQQALAPEAVFDRHRVGFAEQQRHERLDPRPEAARGSMVVAGHEPVDADEGAGQARAQSDRRRREPPHRRVAPDPSMFGAMMTVRCNLSKGGLVTKFHGVLGSKPAAGIG
jgi:hypothetical protein